jgi:amidase
VPAVLQFLVDHVQRRSGGYIETGLPIGLQLVAAHWAEAMLIDTSIRFQDVTDWHSRHPPV